MNSLNNTGTLYIVATPIGNLQDISFRAIEILKKVDHIAAEDTRHSQSLLRNYAITTPILSLHEHNEREQVENLLRQLQSGKSIALISDAGTPLISDPGYYLVKKAHSLGISVVPIPGACAAIAALSASGLPTDRFIFEGFLPAKAQARLQRLTLLKNEPRTLIFYEAPHRILDVFNDLQKVFGVERQAVFARELTKLFETIRAGTLKELTEWVQADADQQRGEIVVMLAGADVSGETSEQRDTTEEVLVELLKHLPLKKAVDVAVKVTGGKKNTLYDRALQIKSERE